MISQAANEESNTDELTRITMWSGLTGWGGVEWRGVGWSGSVVLTNRNGGGRQQQTMGSGVGTQHIHTHDQNPKMQDDYTKQR